VVNVGGVSTAIGWVIKCLRFGFGFCLLLLLGLQGVKTVMNEKGEAPCSKCFVLYPFRLLNPKNGLCPMCDDRDGITPKLMWF